MISALLGLCSSGNNFMVEIYEQTQNCHYAFILSTVCHKCIKMKSGSMDHTCLSAMYNPFSSPSFWFWDIFYWGWCKSGILWSSLGVVDTICIWVCCRHARLMTGVSSVNINLPVSVLECFSCHSWGLVSC